MAITTIGRTAMTDDDGTGTTGTIFNNAWKTSFYNEIDAILSGSDLTIGGTFRTGYTADSTSYTQSNKNLLAGNGGEAVGVAGSTTLANINLYVQGAAQRKACIQASGGVGAGSNGGRLSFFTKDDAASGTDVVQAGYVDYSTGGAGGGLVWGSPTGGSKGAGTINAKAVYDDNVLLTDWVLELAFRGDTALPHAGILYSIEETERVARAECRLPWMPRADVFERERHAGGMITRLVQGQEQQQLYLFDLARRLAALEAR